MKRTNLLCAVILMLILLSISAVHAEPAGQLTLPDHLEIIEAEAFYGDTSISQVILKDSVTEIRSKAFAGSSLTSINLPASLTFIADDALPDPAQVQVAADEGSYAQVWAVTHGYLLTAPVQNASQGKNGQVIVSWNAVDGADTYRVYYGTTAEIADASEANAGAGTSYTVNNLLSGTVYYTWIKAVGPDGRISPASNVKSVITYPSAPTLNEPVVSGKTIALSWNAMPGANVYRLHYSTENDFSTATHIDNIRTTSYTITGLAYNTTYYIWTESANSSGGLRKPTPVSVTTGYNPAAPVQHELQVYMRQITVSWDPLADADCYHVFYGTSDNILEADFVTVDSGTSRVIADLEAGTTYYTWVVAENEAGISDVSNMMHAITYPAAPTINTPTVSENTISLSWNAVTGAERYYVRYNTDNNYSTAARSSSINTTSYTIVGLEFNQKYYIWMDSYNESGGMKTVTPLEVTTGGNSLIPKQAVLKGGVRKVTVNWNAVDSAESYHVYYGTTANFSAAEQISGVTGSSYTVTGLQPGTTYYTWVTAVSGGTESAPSNRKNAITAPPAAPWKTPVVSGNSVTLNWSAVKGASSYYLLYGTNSVYDAAACERSASTGGTTLTVTDLEFDTTYYFWIFSSNSGGAVYNSTAMMATTEAQ